MRLNALAAAILLLAGFTYGVAADPAAPAAPMAASLSAADLAFLATLTEAPPLPDLGVPAPQSLFCNVSNDCGDGNVAYCEGNQTCTTTISGVKCDGNAVDCPNFCTIGQQCQCCTGPQSGFCWSKRGDCQYTSNGIACNGIELTCEQTCPLCPE